MKIIQVIDFSSFGTDWLNIALRASAHADLLWFRIKNEPDDVIKKNAEILRNALPDTMLVLSGRADIAHEMKFQGVHLGANTESPSEVKQKYPELITGYSAHSTDEILHIKADYYTLSPVFFTEKEYEVKPLGVIDVSPMHRTIYALGGINTENAHSLKGMGYAGIAGISFFNELGRLKDLIS